MERSISTIGESVVMDISREYFAEPNSRNLRWRYRSVSRKFQTHASVQCLERGFDTELGSCVFVYGRDFRQSENLVFREFRGELEWILKSLSDKQRSVSGKLPQRGKGEFVFHTGFVALQDFLFAHRDVFPFPLFPCLGIRKIEEFEIAFEFVVGVDVDAAFEFFALEQVEQFLLFFVDHRWNHVDFKIRRLLPVGNEQGHNVVFVGNRILRIDESREFDFLLERPGLEMVQQFDARTGREIFSYGRYEIGEGFREEQERGLVAIEFRQKIRIQVIHMRMRNEYGVDFWHCFPIERDFRRALCAVCRRKIGIPTVDHQPPNGAVLQWEFYEAFGMSQAGDFHGSRRLSVLVFLNFAPGDLLSRQPFNTDWLYLAGNAGFSNASLDEVEHGFRM